MPSMTPTRVGECAGDFQDDGGGVLIEGEGFDAPALSPGPSPAGGKGEQTGAQAEARYLARFAEITASATLAGASA